MNNRSMVRRWWGTVNLLFTLCASFSHAKEVLTNHIQFLDSPSWLNERMIEKATGPVQDFLQWDIHRIRAYAHTESSRFRALHGMGPEVKAFFRRADTTVHIGPEVNEKNFHAIFSHELVHAIFFQKYKGAIPAWLEEGLANYLGRVGSVDYAWLASQPFQDVTRMSHPHRDPLGVRFHYQTSTAVAEMISSKCSLHDLLHLSVGRKLETYLSTYCEMGDVNAAYREWIVGKASASKKNQLGKSNPQRPPQQKRSSSGKRAQN